MADAIRVVLADERQLLRFSRRGPPPPELDAGSQRQAESAQELRRLCQELASDVLLLDLDEPGPSVLEAVRQLREACPDIKVLVLTTDDGGDFVRELARAGVSGYLLKSESCDMVMQAVRAIKGGGTWFSRETIGKLVRRDVTREEFDLTEREWAVLGALVRGWDNARIASELAISEQTVRNYVSRVYDKLGVRTRAEAIVWAIRHGFDSKES